MLPYMIMTLLPTIAGAWSHPCGVFCHISDPIQGFFCIVALCCLQLES